MDDNANPVDAPQQQQPVSRLTLIFQAPGSSEFQLQVENITPAQMLTAATWLDWFARKQFDSQLAQATQQPGKLVVPAGVQIRGRNGVH